MERSDKDVLEGATFTVIANTSRGKITVEIPQTSATAASLRKLIEAIVSGNAPGEWTEMRT